MAASDRSAVSGQHAETSLSCPLFARFEAFVAEGQPCDASPERGLGLCLTAALECLNIIHGTTGHTLGATRGVCSRGRSSRCSPHQAMAGEHDTPGTLEFDAYDWLPECTVSCLDNSKQTFDLKGRIFKTKSPLYVENKAYTTVGNQAADYMDFLAIAYSATAAEIARTQDPKWQFMWVTTHPFSQGKWPDLTKRSQIKKALEADTSGLLNGQDIDDDLLTVVAERVWLLVLNKRQHELTLSPKELHMIESKLNRKGKA